LVILLRSWWLGGYSELANQHLQHKESAMAKNVLGGELETCSNDPVTGFFRNGCCDTGKGDVGLHVVCAVMTDAFLQFTAKQGNNLSEPVPEFNFPGLKAGDRWCLCAARWEEARQAAVAPPVVLEATHMAALEHLDLDQLKAHAVAASGE
jgi:uncharacterized protein (DUF2237 family)